MILLRFGIAHTIVLNVDNNFYNIFRKICGLLDLHIHTVGGGNHDPMLAECVNNNLNKGLNIFTQEQGTLGVIREAVFAPKLHLEQLCSTLDWYFKSQGYHQTQHFLSG